MLKLKDKDGKIRVKALVAVLIVGLLAGLGAWAGVAETRMSQAYAGSALDADCSTCSVALTAASAQYTLPVSDGSQAVRICAIGNTAYVLCDTNPTVSIAAGGFTIVVPEGTCQGPFRIVEAKCAQIAASAAGFIVYQWFDPNITVGP
jgi:hypothetical protein